MYLSFFVILQLHIYFKVIQILENFTKIQDIFLLSFPSNLQASTYLFAKSTVTKSYPFANLILVNMDENI